MNESTDRELDHAVAIHVLGWRLAVPEEVLAWKPHIDVWHTGSRSEPLCEGFSPSESIRDAMSVFDKLRYSGKWCCLNIHVDHGYSYRIDLTPANASEHKPISVSGFQHDLRKAICIAALRSVNYDTSEFERPRMRRFQCSGCGDIVESEHDLSGSRHDVPQTAKCSGMTSLFEI